MNNNNLLYFQAIGSCDPSDEFLAEAVLQQALNGPGPNTLVLSYLTHSLFSKVSFSNLIQKYSIKASI